MKHRPCDSTHRVFFLEHKMRPKSNFFKWKLYKTSGIWNWNWSILQVLVLNQSLIVQNLISQKIVLTEDPLYQVHSSNVNQKINLSHFRNTSAIWIVQIILVFKLFVLGDIHKRHKPIILILWPPSLLLSFFIAFGLIILKSDVIFEAPKLNILQGKQ